MKSVHVRNVTPVTIAAIKRLARAHKRSMQGELREILERAARQAPPEEGDEEFRLITVNTGRKSAWNREKIYGESGR
jgi:plasmid stability protein